jgi:NAD(P)-dependent dehydrogenase (short-subunit alcohol dehydrogenase family)
MNISEKLSLRGKNVWITGAKRIGKSIALALGELGANVVVSYRSSKQEADEVIEDLKPLGVKTLTVQCDTSEQSSVKAAVDVITKEFGSLDILVLMASIFKPVSLDQIAEKDWDDNFSVHVKGSFWPVQSSLPILNQGAHILMISDRTALGKIYPGYLPYVVTKSAVAALTRALAVELGPKGIYVNAIAPGPILKPDDITEAEWEEIRNSSIIKNKITDDDAVDEFVQTVVRLCHAKSSGSVYPLDLGMN